MKRNHYYQDKHDFLPQHEDLVEKGRELHEQAVGKILIKAFIGNRFFNHRRQTLHAKALLQPQK